MPIRGSSSARLCADFFFLTTHEFRLSSLTLTNLSFYITCPNIASRDQQEYHCVHLQYIVPSSCDPSQVYRSTKYTSSSHQLAAFSSHVYFSSFISFCPQNIYSL
jgi:hypothetical protein